MGIEPLLEWDRPATYRNWSSMCWPTEMTEERDAVLWKVFVVWHIRSSLQFSLENSWWSLAVHHSIYHQYFVKVCRNSHKVEFSVDILCCDFFGDFYNAPKTNADSWTILVSAQRKVKAVPFFEANPALQPCPPCPWKASRITQWTRLETDHYICNRKFKQVLLDERGLWAGDEKLHWGLVPDWLQLFPGHPAEQMGSAPAVGRNHSVLG